MLKKRICPHNHEKDSVHLKAAYIDAFMFIYRQIHKVSGPTHNRQAQTRILGQNLRRSLDESKILRAL